MGSCLAAGRRGAWESPAQPPGAEQTGAAWLASGDIDQWGSTPSGIREEMQIIQGLVILAPSERGVGYH